MKDTLRLLRTLLVALFLLLALCMYNNPVQAQAIGVERVKVTPWDKVKDTVTKPLIVQTIHKAAARVSVSGRYLEQVAIKESNLHPKATNKYSTSKGLYQFIDSTWYTLVGRYGLQYDVLPEDRIDPYKSTIMAGLFTLDNQRYLEAKLRRAPTYKELYLAHFSGAQGAYKLLKADPRARVGDVLGMRVEKANPHIRGKTVAQAIAIITKGIDND